MFQNIPEKPISSTNWKVLESLGAKNWSVIQNFFFSFAVLAKIFAILRMRSIFVRDFAVFCPIFFPPYVVSFLCIVRPTKKPTNFGPIRGVPKSGVWRANSKKVLHGDGGEGRFGQSRWRTFLRF
jgi:hypothetical protein